MLSSCKAAAPRSGAGLKPQGSFDEEGHDRVTAGCCLRVVRSQPRSLCRRAVCWTVYREYYAGLHVARRSSWDRVTA